MAQMKIEVTVMDSDKVKRLLKRLRKLKWKRANRYAQVKGRK